jgi:hypothetical protein
MQVNRTTIIVSWQPIPKHARHGIILRYEIYYKKARTSEDSTTLRAENDEREKILTDLTPATEYRIEMAGVTSVGLGTKSKAKYATTGIYGVLGLLYPDCLVVHISCKTTCKV